MKLKYCLLDNIQQTIGWSKENGPTDFNDTKDLNIRIETKHLGWAQKEDLKQKKPHVCKNKSKQNKDKFLFPRNINY